MPATAVRPRLHDRYDDEVVPHLRERFGYGNVMAVPRLRKVVCNMGVGKAIDAPKRIEAAVDDLARVTGQRPVITRAKQSVSGFRIRKGNAIGCKVTLRRQRMWEFLDRLISVAIPRIRDFRGLSPRSFDGRGNYAMGLAEQTVFPEIDPDEVEFMQGMDVCIVTTAETDEEGRELLDALGFPFRKQ